MEGKTYFCGVDPPGSEPNFTFRAAAGPGPGHFIWHINDNDQSSASFLVSDVDEYTVSATYYYDGEGGGSVELDGGTVQGIEAGATVDGSTEGYIAVDGPRKEIVLAHDPQAPGDRNRVEVTVDGTGLALYTSETGGTSFTHAVWDDYSEDNWGELPTSVWAEATQTGEKHVTITFTASNQIYPSYYASGSDSATVTLNSLQLNLQIDGKGESDEEDPGVYINVNWDDDDGDGWTENGAPPDAEYTGDKDDSEVDPGGTGGGDNDLRACVLTLTGPASEGTVDLTFPANIKCWATRTKKDNGQSSAIASGEGIDVEDLPKTIFVEGVSGSASFKDVELRATYSEEADVTDKANVTVFEVTLTGIFSGEQQDDNSSRFSSFHASSDMNGKISWDDANGDGIKGDLDSNCM